MIDIFYADVRLPKSRCPYCEHLLDTTTGLRTNDGAHPERPEPGDWTVCGHCSQFLIFQFDLTVGKPSPGSFETASRIDPQFKRRMEMLGWATRQIDRRTNRMDRRKQKRQARNK